MSESNPQYGANGFVPTVDNVSWEGDDLVLETIDPNRESDIIGREGEPLKRRAEYATTEQKDKFDLRK